MGILGDMARRDLRGGKRKEDEQVDRLDREDAKIIADKHPVLKESNPDGTQSSVQCNEPMKVCEICIRFNSGLVMSLKGGDVEEVISAIRKILN